VFQSFALYPWLTVLQNVELGCWLETCRATNGANRPAAIDWSAWMGSKTRIPKSFGRDEATRRLRGR